ncbi:hypothetical protein BC343_25295 [Mucilaginibacter pedocola]|uniref:MFS transporter n=1 Tax=Mucilaginibacter pedocola TaxID=1792845 RepID=A0A1S9PIN7_9SPHI|nr:hypothetical protein BC343_25295 [Mucilaginibacter pedocola]
MRYVTFLYLYVMQGVPAGFALTAMANYFTGKGLSSQSVGSFVAIVGIPWVLQFFWGPIIDRYQYSVIGHRKQWIVLTQLMALIASLGLLYINNPIGELTTVSAAFFIHSIFASVQDASVDALAISIVPENERGRVNAFMRGGFLAGIALGSAGLSLVLYHYGFHAAVLSQSALLFILTTFTFFTKLDPADRYLPNFRQRTSDKTNVKENPKLGWLFRQLFSGLMKKDNFNTFIVIATVYTCNGVFIRSFSFYLIHNLKWQYNDVSVLQGGWCTIATIAITVIGGIIADKLVPTILQLRVMIGIGLFLIILGLSHNLWLFKPYSGTGLILWNLADPMFSVAAMPILMSLCIQKVEGSQFTAYMALVNLCDVVGAYLSGWMMAITPAPTIGLICGVAVLFLGVWGYVRRKRELSIKPF